jgi:hypothetical protein
MRNFLLGAAVMRLDQKRKPTLSVFGHRSLCERYAVALPTSVGGIHHAKWVAPSNLRASMASCQQHLWALLGMKMGEDMIHEPVQAIPEEHVQPLPDEATTRQKSRVGEQQPVRASGGRTPRQREYGELSFFWDSRGASVSTNPSDRSGETPVSSVRSSQKGDNSGRTRHLFPSHAAAHYTCEQRPSVDQARDNLDQEVARSAVYAPRSFGMQERTSSHAPH